MRVLPVATLGRWSASPLSESIRDALATANASRIKCGDLLGGEVRVAVGPDGLGVAVEQRLAVDPRDPVGPAPEEEGVSAHCVQGAEVSLGEGAPLLRLQRAIGQEPVGIGQEPLQARPLHDHLSHDLVHLVAAHASASSRSQVKNGVLLVRRKTQSAAVAGCPPATPTRATKFSRPAVKLPARSIRSQDESRRRPATLPSRTWATTRASNSGSGASRIGRGPPISTDRWPLASTAT